MVRCQHQPRQGNPSACSAAVMAFAPFPSARKPDALQGRLLLGVVDQPRRVGRVGLLAERAAVRRVMRRPSAW